MAERINSITNHQQIVRRELRGAESKVTGSNYPNVRDCIANLTGLSFIKEADICLCNDERYIVKIPDGLLIAFKKANGWIITKTTENDFRISHIWSNISDESTASGGEVVDYILGTPRGKSVNPVFIKFSRSVNNDVKRTFYATAELGKVILHSRRKSSGSELIIEVEGQAPYFSVFHAKTGALKDVKPISSLPF